MYVHISSAFRRLTAENLFRRDAPGGEEGDEFLPGHNEAVKIAKLRARAAIVSQRHKTGFYREGMLAQGLRKEKSAQNLRAEDGVKGFLLQIEPKLPGAIGKNLPAVTAAAGTGVPLHAAQVAGKKPGETAGDKIPAVPAKALPALGGKAGFHLLKGGGLFRGVAAGEDQYAHEPPPFRGVIC